MKLVKVTEFFGFAYDDHDGPQFVSIEPVHRQHVAHMLVRDLAPEGAVSPDWGQENRVRGRWRITVEFEPEDGAAGQGTGGA